MALEYADQDASDEPSGFFEARSFAHRANMLVLEPGQGRPLAVAP